jgi:rhodanese-related sulfurtransferase
VAQEHDAVHALNYNVAVIIDFLRHNILLVAAAVGSGAMLLWPLLRDGLGGGSAVDTLQATQLMNRQNAVVLDLREPAAYAAGHIIGAKNLPLAELAKRAGDFDKFKSRPVIVHCDTGGTAGRAVAQLKARGFTQVVNLAGGFRAWAQANLPVER